MDITTASVVLTLTVVMSNNMPSNKYMGMPTIDDCVANVKAWGERGVTPEMEKQGAVSVSATCLVRNLHAL